MGRPAAARALLGVALAMVAGAGAAQQATPAAASLCIEPRAPALWARQPARPLCALEYRCLPAQVADYQADLSRYEAAMAQYRDEAQGYAVAARRYVACRSAAIGDRSLQRPR